MSDDEARTDGRTPPKPRCGEPGHEHERPEVPDLDELWIQAFSYAGLAAQDWAADKGLSPRLKERRLLVMHGFRLATMLARYMPELSERVQQAVLSEAAVKVVMNGRPTGEGGSALDAPIDHVLCGQFDLVDRANEIVAMSRANGAK